MLERYVAFLRGINVSGQKIIKMEALRSMMAEAGFIDVKTYIQSGNMMFYAEESNAIRLTEVIENLIEKTFGFQTDVILRKFSDIELFVNSPIFNNLKLDTDKKYYITFLKEKFAEPIPIPTFSGNKDVEICHQHNMDLISISTIYKGNYGFPNSFIEKLTGIPATTRNPNTLEKILKLGLIN